jgi:hypothetical protein
MHDRKTGKDPHQYRIGTWNVRTPNQGGKGVSEMRWKGQGEVRSGDCTTYYSRGEKSERGVPIVVHKSIVESVVKKIVCNDRLIVAKLNTEPVNVLIVQVYMLMSVYEDEEVEELYDRIEDILEEDGKGTQTLS